MPKTNIKDLTDDEIQRLIQLVGKTQWDYKLQQYETAALEEILKTVRKARIEIGAKLAKVKQTSTLTVERLNAMADELQDITVAIQAQIAGEITGVAVVAGAESYAVHNDLLSFGGRIATFNPVALTAEQLHSMVVKTPVGGRLLSEWVERTFDSNVRDALKAEITAGMMQGEGYPSMIKRVKSVIAERLDRDIESLTRTYVQSVNVQASQDVAKANSDIVKGWKWNSVCENRTCMRCFSLDSRDEIYPLGGGPEIPLHIRCRCFPEDVTKSFKELGINVGEIKKAYRPGVIRDDKGKIIKIDRLLGTYDEFFKLQSKAVQTKILGPGRYALWKDGLPLSKLTDKGGTLKLLKEL